MKYYKLEIEKEMRIFFESLNEKEKRIFLATEVKKIGHGAQTYLAKILKCCRKTIYNALQMSNYDILNSDRIRKKGGGRKPYYLQYPKIDSVFKKCIDKNTAGNPMNENQKWTNLNLKDIVECLNDKGTHVSDFVIRKLLKKHGYVKRSNQKKSH